MLMKKYLTLFISILIGITFWIIMTYVTEDSEAWDNPLYFKIGLPVLGLINILLGIINPNKPWRWGLLSTISQAFPMVILSNGEANLWPLTIIAFAILSIPMILANYIGYFIRTKMLKKGTNSSQG